MTSPSIEIDLDKLLRLAIDNPEEFAGQRELLIRKLIRCSTSPGYMEKMQMDVDGIRYGSAPGLDASQEMVRQILQNSILLKTALSKLNALLEEFDMTKLHP